MPRKCPCGTRASFNVRGKIIGVCCSKCKTSEMINVMSKRCSCGSQPCFNMPGEKNGMCCFKCKIPGMIDVLSKKCSCGTRPSYNVPSKTIGVCCMKCKTDDMIIVMNKKCPCGKQPVFNVPGETIGVCCKDCKTSEMVDVKTKRCSCGSLSMIFNVPGKTVGILCGKCKTSGMIDVVNKRCSCGTRPVYNVPGETNGICCVKCKTGDMIDVVSKICPGYDYECPTRTYVSRGHDYCMSCDPNDARRKLYKRFEEAFFDYVKDKLDVHKREFRVSFDPSETAKKYARLDGIIFGDGIVVCLEVDENGHQDYNCDEHRMHLVTAELLQKYPYNKVSWVRVNPTVDAKNQWSKPSKKLREKRFEEVVTVVNDMLTTHETRVVYIGFD